MEVVVANPLRARTASPPLNEVLAHWFRHSDPTRTKKPRQKAGLSRSMGLAELRRPANPLRQLVAQRRENSEKKPRRSGLSHHEGPRMQRKANQSA